MDSESKTSEWVVSHAEILEEETPAWNLAYQVDQEIHTIRARRRGMSDIVEEAFETALEPPADVYYTAQIMIVITGVLFVWGVTGAILSVFA